MLTPKQLKSYDFQSVGRNAYKSTDVDEFMSEVYESYEQMFRENGELVKKLSLLAEKLSEYKNDSDNIKNALLAAERMKDSIVKEAENQAKETLAATEEKVKVTIETANDKTTSMVQKANDSADKILSDAKTEAHDVLKSAKDKATLLLTKAENMYSEKMDNLEVEVKREQAVLDTLKSSSNELRAKLKDLYTSHLELIEDMPVFETSYEENEYTQDYKDNYKEEPDDVDADEVKTLKSFLDESQSEDNSEYEMPESSYEESEDLEDSKIDNYINDNNEDINENDIDSYIDDDDDEDVRQYVPLEYISDEEDDDNDKDNYSQNPKADEETLNTEEGTLLQGYDEEINEEETDEEDIDDLSVNIDSLYEDDDDEDVNTLKNFLKEKETQEY